MSLFAELKRRNVFRVGIAYLITAWLLLQVADVMIDNIGAPEWLFQAILLVLAIGFVIALIFAWAFEMTPEGLKRDAEIDHRKSVARETGRKLDRAIIVVLLLSLAYFVWESRFADDEKPVTSEEVVATPVNPAEQARPDPVGAPVAAEKSVAVLPFMNMSSDPEQEYFSDGITEEVINALVKVPGLSVPARTSVFAYKGRLQDVRDIGRELNVAHVLEGSIRSQGKQVRITAQLINIDSGYHLWSETFDRQLENIFAVQEEIAGAIAEVLVGELGVQVAAVPNQTRNMEAYDLYLQGRAALRDRDESAISLFEEVTQRDPDFVPGWASLAMAHNSVDDNDNAAISAAEKALAMDPDNVDALNAMGAALRGLHQWADAERYLERALAIDPSSAELLEDYAEFLNFVGRSDEALEVTTRGLQIEPGLLPLMQEHATGLLSAERRKEARAVAARMMELSEQRGWFWMINVWLTPIEPGQSPEVPPRPELDRNATRQPQEQEYLRLMNSEGLSNLNQAWGREMRAFLEQQLAKGEDVGDRAWSARSALVLAGQVDFVIDTFLLSDTATRAGSFEWIWTPILAPLRKHPRFPEYLENSGMIAYWDATAWPKWCQRDDDGEISCE